MSLNDLKVTQEENVPELSKLSTENLIIWVIGRSEELKRKITHEDIVLECWLINPEKHSLRGHPEFPDSFVIIKRIFDMKGRKGLLDSNFALTRISRTKYQEIKTQLKEGNVKAARSRGADRTITSREEAPYKRLVRTSAYSKYASNKKEQIVESDYLYFYGISWNSKRTTLQGRMKNVDAVVDDFAVKNPTLKELRDYLSMTFKKTKEDLSV